MSARPRTGDPPWAKRARGVYLYSRDGASHLTFDNRVTKL